MLNLDAFSLEQPDALYNLKYAFHSLQNTVIRYWRSLQKVYLRMK